MLSLDPSLNFLPDKISHIHIMGICGTGMAALAGMLLKSGYRITGSDHSVYPPMSTFLDQLGIAVTSGYKHENLSPHPDLVIVGNVIRQSNDEAQALAKLGLPYLSFPQALSNFFIKSRSSIVVAGTHGKTSTCSLLASCLYNAQFDPTFMIGGIVQEFQANFRLGKGKYFIAEGDEYDTAFFDKNSKFLHYRPEIAIITSIEFDHADIFDNLEQIKRSFKSFIKLLPENGLLIANFDDENVVEVSAGAKCSVQSYGTLPDYDWSLSCLSPVNNEKTSFEIFNKGQFGDKVTLRQPGKHNCLNALAATAAMHHIGMTKAQINNGLKGFGGVKRRQEIRCTVNNITVIDDFAHHPTAVSKTLSALKAAYGTRRLIAVFEPRTNSSRRAIFQQNYAGSFSSADIAILKEPIPLEGIAEKEMFSSKRLAKDINSQSITKAETYETTDQILTRLNKLLEKDDVVAILSNGGFDNIHNRLEKQLLANYG